MKSQAVSNFKLTITPMQMGDRIGDDLVIHPGEPSEIIVQVQNLRAQPLRLTLSVTGNFPSDWCQLGTEGQEILPQAQMDAVLYFQVPAAFFEDQQALRPQQQLQLQYRVLINVRGSMISQAKTNQSELIESEQIEFNLHIRPRSIYLNFLPNLYREAVWEEATKQHSESIDFIGRFLKIFEQAFEPAVDTLDAMWANLDPLTASQAMLPFLAHWVGWRAQPSWQLASQRRLIRQAVELYRWRGTRKGLQLYLHYYTGLSLEDSTIPESEKQISITEFFGEGFILGNTVLGETTILGGGKPFHFCVHLRISADHSTEHIEESTLRQIIEQEKPAFCTYDLIIDRF